MFSDFMTILQSGIHAGGSFVLVRIYITWPSYGVRDKVYFEYKGVEMHS